MPLDAGVVECKDQQKVHWVEVELLGAAEVPDGYERYEIKLSDGALHTGVLDAHGWIRLGPFVPSGPCTVAFPMLDRRAWSPIDSLPAHSGAFQSGFRREQGPAGASVALREGDCCSSVAEAAGHLWSTIWDHPDNAALRNDCDDPNCLIPGRGLAVPPIERREESVPVDQRHRFRFDNEAKLVIRITWPDGAPRRSVSFQLTIDGVVVKDEVSASGPVAVPALRPGARQGQLLVRGAGGVPGVPEQKFRFTLGTLRGYREAAGVQQRLRNLGHRQTDSAGTDASKAAAAIRIVQKAAREAETGKAADVANRLRNDHSA